MIEIAAAAWRLRRSKFVETAMFDLEIGKQRQQLEETHDNPDQPLRHASAMMSVGGNINLLERYETRAGRAYDRAVRNFDNLRARRRKSNDDRVPQTPLFARRPQEESQPCECGPIKKCTQTTTKKCRRTTTKKCRRTTQSPLLHR
jgi:hypothetical protein